MSASIAIVSVILVWVVSTNCGTAPVVRNMEDEEPVPVMRSGQVVEVETDRLVCGVIYGSQGGQSFGTYYAISCVPKIPGLFEEGGTR